MFRESLGTRLYPHIVVALFPGSCPVSHPASNEKLSKSLGTSLLYGQCVIRILYKVSKYIVDNG